MEFLSMIGDIRNTLVKDGGSDKTKIDYVYSYFHELFNQDRIKLLTMIQNEKVTENYLGHLGEFIKQVSDDRDHEQNYFYIHFTTILRTVLQGTIITSKKEVDCVTDKYYCLTVNKNLLSKCNESFFVEKGPRVKFMRIHNKIEIDKNPKVYYNIYIPKSVHKLFGGINFLEEFTKDSLSVGTVEYLIDITFVVWNFFTEIVKKILQKQ